MRQPARNLSSWIVSAAFHGAVLLSVLLAAVVMAPPALLPPPHTTKMPLRLRARAPKIQSEESGGGQNSPGPAKKGRLPVQRPRRAFVAPQLATVEQPRLAVDVAWSETPEVDVDAGDIGDPLGQIASRGGGLGEGGGFGDGHGQGIGEGSGRGFSDSTVSRLKVTRTPRILFKIEPEYSEQARRAHLQGFVQLRIDVGIDGRPVNIRVVHGIGLGLDENAIEAVKRWRFSPALAGDRPVVAPALVEVAFHLL